MSTATRVTIGGSEAAGDLDVAVAASYRRLRFMSQRARRAESVEAYFYWRRLLREEYASLRRLVMGQEGYRGGASY